MKKYLFSAFFFLSLVFLGLNTATNSSIAEECHTTSDGKVIVEPEIIIETTENSELNTGLKGNPQ